MFQVYSTCLISAVLATAANAGHFGNQDIDYWNEGKTFPELSINALRERQYKKQQKELEPSVEAMWSNVMDPNNPEYWDNSNYVPPRPYREVIKNPTDENIKAFLAWKRKQAADFGRFLAKLKAYGAVSEAAALATPPVAQVSSSQFDDINWQDVKIIYFYSNSCSACRRNLKSINALKAMGPDSTFIEMDGSGQNLHPGSISWDQTMAQHFKVKATPTAYIRLSSGLPVTISGARSVAEYISIIKKLQEVQQ